MKRSRKKVFDQEVDVHKLEVDEKIDEVVVKITGEAVEVHFLYIKFIQLYHYPRLPIYSPLQLNPPQCLPQNSV